MTRMVKISRRPTSISVEQSHLMPDGSIDQLIVGPISRPSDGPTLPMELRTMVMALVLSMPAAMMMNEATHLTDQDNIRVFS